MPRLKPHREKLTRHGPYSKADLDNYQPYAGPDDAVTSPDFLYSDGRKRSQVSDEEHQLWLNQYLHLCDGPFPKPGPVWFATGPDLPVSALAPVRGHMTFTMLEEGFICLSPYSHPDARRNSNDDPLDRACYLPLDVIERVVIVYHCAGNPFARLPMIDCYQVLIMPRGSTGATGATAKYPHIVSFAWPEKQLDNRLKGSSLCMSQHNDTYISALVRAFRMGGVATVVRGVPVEDAKDKQSSEIMQVWFSMGNVGEDLFVCRDPGWIWLLDTAILFLSREHTIYIRLDQTLESVLTRNEMLHGSKLNASNGHDRQDFSWDCWVMPSSRVEQSEGVVIAKETVKLSFRISCSNFNAFVDHVCEAYHRQQQLDERLIVRQDVVTITRKW